jgi:hypothetical protein
MKKNRQPLKKKKIPYFSLISFKLNLKKNKIKLKHVESMGGRP